jgi:hypothetical protein
MIRICCAIVLTQAMLCYAQIGEGDARYRLWVEGTGATNATATSDGAVVVEINGSVALAAEAMAIPASTVADYVTSVADEMEAAALAPRREATGIDTPVLVLDAPDGKGVGYVVTQDGTLLPIVYAHESPYDMDDLSNKKQAALTAYTARMEAAGFTVAEMEALRAFRDVDIDVLFATLTVAQRRFLKILQDAVVLQVKERILGALID